MSFGKSKAKLLSEIGTVYREMTSYDTALIHYNRSRLILSNIKDSAGLAETYNRIGQVYDTKGEFEKSLEVKSEPVGIYEMRRHFSNYFKGLPHFREMRITSEPCMPEPYSRLRKFRAVPFL